MIILSVFFSNKKVIENRIFSRLSVFTPAADKTESVDWRRGKGRGTKPFSQVRLNYNKTFVSLKH